MEGSMETVFDRAPDAEVTFRFNGTRRGPAADGYRPAHRIREGRAPSRPASLAR